MNSKIKQKFDEYIQKKGMRHTSQRNVILDVIFSSDEHFTVEKIFNKIKKVDPNTSRATLYRTISLLLDCNLLQEIDIGKGERLYDPNFLDFPNHNHLVCIDCNKVLEFDNKEVSKLIESVSKNLGFSSNSGSMNIRACCDTLRLNGVCDNLINMRLKKNL